MPDTAHDTHGKADGRRRRWLLPAGTALVAVSLGLAALAGAAGLTAWRDLQDAELRAALARQKAAELVDAQNDMRLTSVRLIAEAARGLREAEPGDPEALGRNLAALGELLLRPQALDLEIRGEAGGAALDLLEEAVETLLDVGQAERAREVSEQAVALAERRTEADEPGASIDRVRARVLLARAEWRSGGADAARGRLEEARRELLAHLQENPDDAEATAALADTLLPLSRILHEAGEEEAAIRVASAGAGVWSRVPGENLRWLESRGRLLLQLSEWRLEAGDTAGLADAAGDAAGTWAALAEARPGSRAARAALARAHLLQGRALLARGEAERAREALWEAYAGQRALQAEAAPREPGVPIASTLEALGAAATEAGDSAVAAQVLQEATRLRRGELEAARDDRSAVLRLSQSLVALGRAQVETGALGAALDAYEESLRRLGELEAQESEDPAIRTALADVWQAIGELRLREGQAQSALAFFEQAASALRDVVQAQPSAFEPQSKLAITLLSLGEARADTGDTARAAEAYRDLVEIRRALSEAEPANRARRQALAQGLVRLGETTLRLDQPEAARPLYAEAAELVETERSRTPASLRQASDIAARLGDFALSDGDTDEALSRYRQALDMREEISAADEANADLPVAVANARSRVGDALRTGGRIDEARQSYEACTQEMRPLVEADRYHVRATRQLAMCLYKLAVVLDGERREAAQAEAEALITPLVDAELLSAETRQELDSLQAELSAS
ncbi:hypothetical protein [Lutibaculum baratangense]|uniref:Tetratricopeptide repeat protein n=1 Tax=Lutibaculum baratangense AMV1 TaxID=631454 RepID=V4R2K8_9HYPH|nr:hypothetical protein [Lutibaculum baratangense]ESR26187.1 hypothetical protein N177_1046 [Lutibaculum baratangense AMV1]